MALATLTGPASVAIVLLFAIGVTSGVAMNLYCGTLSAITLGQTFMPQWKAGPTSRVIVATMLSMASLYVELVSQKDFLANYTHFFDLMLYIMVPWTAVNLVDFYLVRQGDYHVPSFFMADGGIYGKCNWAAMLCYFLGILVQVPFIASTLYTGPITKALGGVDISWVVGIAVVSPVYYFAIRAFPGTVVGSPALQPAGHG
jgi:NCS1 family nucleobase:cation symporter-1